MTNKLHAIPRDCIGVRETEASLKTFTGADAEELRHQMYLYCIINGFAKNKEDAKLLLKKFGFLRSKRIK